MSPRAFDRFLVDVEIGTNRKLRRFSSQERWCFVAGVLAIAAKSPERGCLLVSLSIPADENDYAEQAGVTVAVARETIAKLKRLDMVFEAEGRWFVHDFDQWQRKPRKPSEDPEAVRDRKRKSRGSHAEITPPDSVTKRDVTRNRNREEEVPPSPPTGGDPATVEFDTWLQHHQQVTDMRPPATTTKAFAEIRTSYTARRDEGWTAADLTLAVLGAWHDDHRREHGYVDPISVLRPTKILALVERGRKHAASRTPGADVDTANAVLDRQKAARQAALTATDKGDAA